MFERILVPLDGSQFSARALPYALEVAKRFGGEIILLRVVRPTPLVVPGASPVGGMVSGTAMNLIAQTVMEQDTNNTAQARRYLEKSAGKSKRAD